MRKGNTRDVRPEGMMMRLITLNVKGASKTRKEFVPHQVAALLTSMPDVIALSEVAINRLADYEREFQRRGLDYVLNSVVEATPLLTGSRSVGTLIASRFPCTIRPEAHALCTIPWPERLLSAALETDAGIIEIDVAYIPYYYQGDPKLIEIKIETLDGLYHRLARASKNHRIVCGDFNLPFGETEDGEIVTFGKSALQRRLHDAERRILLGLADFDLHDVFRGLHGYSRREYSWYVPATGNGFRLDHVLASKSLNATTCRYLHAYREIAAERPWGATPRSLSDHAAIDVTFDPIVLAKHDP